MDPYSPFPDDDPTATVVDSSSSSSAAGGANHGWQKVVYPKRNRRNPPPPATAAAPAANGAHSAHVFASIEQHAAERRRAIESAAAAATAAEARTAVARSEDDEDESGGEVVNENGGAEVKKVKEKKPKKPKVTVAEAAAKIDAGDLSAFLVDISGSYESQQDIQLMRLSDYFGRAFASVSASQFPWAKLFKESPVSKIIDIPLCHISDAVYKTSADWIAQKSPEALGEFILWCLERILADLASQQATAKGSKKSVQQTPSKAQVAIFVVLAITLRRKPDVLINLLPKLRDNPKYQGHEKFPVTVWVIGQASQGDLVVGMHAWAHYLLPLICGKSNVNPLSRDLALQLVERILSGPKALSVLRNGAVRKGERVVPPPALDILLRAAFPAQSARVKATERFEAIYPTLKVLALTGDPGTKATKQASQQILPLSVKAMQENNPELAKEAANIFIWCLSHSPDCYRQWEKLYLDNMDASVTVLRKLSNEWKEHSDKLSSEALRETLKVLHGKNEEALSGPVDAGNHAAIKDADKYCKLLLRRVTHSSSCIKAGVFVLVLAVAVGYVASPDMESLDWEKFHATLRTSLENFPSVLKSYIE